MCLGHRQTVTHVRSAMQAGDQVRVVAGTHTGQTGMVLTVDSNTGVCVLHSDATRDELQVLTRHLARSTAATAALDT